VCNGNKAHYRKHLKEEIGNALPKFALGQNR